MHLKLEMRFSTFVSSSVDNALYKHVWLSILGSVTFVVVPKSLCKDQRVLYSHGKKEGLWSLSGTLRSVSNQAKDANTCIVPIALNGGGR